MTFDLAAMIEQEAEAAPQFGAGVFPPVVPGRWLHLDGDYMAYYSAGKDETSPGEARRNALDRIELTRLRAGAEKVRVHLSASGCTKAHRYLIATVKPYQAQRAGSRKPKNWGYLREILEHYEGPLFTPKVWTTREADDGLAYCAAIDDIVISTRDKDMQMLPGTHINWMTYQLTDVPRGAWEVIGADEKTYGLKWFYLQLLQGDAADHIPGIPKLFGKLCADKTAAKYLAPCQGRDTAYDYVQAAYQDHYGETWADSLIEQAGLLWLRTDAQATIPNVLEAFPNDKRLAAAADRLVDRVTRRLNEYAQIKGH